MIRILVADDHPAVLRGLKQLLALECDIRVVGEAGNGQQVLEMLGCEHLDLILLDLNMPGPSGVDLIARIRARDPHCPILVFSMCNEPQIARAVCKAGAAGFVTKDSDPDVLLGAIRMAAAGQGVRTGARD